MNPVSRLHDLLETAGRIKELVGNLQFQMAVAEAQVLVIILRDLEAAKHDPAVRIQLGAALALFKDGRV